MPPPPPGQHARLAPLVSPIPRASTNFTPRFHSTNSSSLSSSNDRPSPANTPHPPSHPSLSLPRPQSRQTSGPRVIQADPNLANPVRITPVSFRVPREGRSTNAMSSTPIVTPSRDPPVKVIPSVPLPLNKRPSTRDDTRWNPLPRSRTTSMSTMSQLSRDHFAPLEPMTVSPTTNSTQHSSHNAPSTRPMPHTRIPPRTQFIFSNSSPSPNYTSPLSPTPSNRPSFSPIVSKHLPPTDAQASLRPHVEEIPTKAAQAPPIRARKLTLQTTAEALGTSQRPILVEVRPENVTSQASTVHLGEPVRSPYLGPRIVSPILPRSSTSPPVSPAVPRPSFKLDWESKWEEAKKRWDEEDRALREGFTRAAQNTQTGFKARCDSPSPTSFSSSTGRQTPKYEWSVPVPNVLGGSRTHSRASSDPRPQLSRQASSYYGSDVQEDSSSISSSRASLSSSSSSTSSSSSFDSSSSFTSASDESAQAPRSRSNTFPREEEKAWERLFVLLDDLWDGDRTRGTMAADPSVGKAWESYESRWDKLTSQPLSEPLTFTDIPWPVSLTVVPASDRLAQTLNVRNIRNFLLSPSHSKGKGKKERVKTALLRWHNDKFEGRWMKQVQEEHRALVKEAVGLVSRSLNEIMTSLNEGGA